jgi:hypothetical protein
MWARVIELMLGLWLVISPFIFAHAAATHHVICGTAVVTFALLSFRYSFRYAHLGIGLVALWLIAAGYVTGHPAPPSSQNYILVGLLLLMFAIIPNEANLPPRAWRLEDQ